MSGPSGPFVLPRATHQMWATKKRTTVHFNTKATVIVQLKSQRFGLTTLETVKVGT